MKDVNRRARHGALILAILALAAAASLAAPARADTLLERFTARLGERDHFNSRGVRLRSVAAIIRQDRANFHRFGVRDPEDEPDSFFASKRNRAALEDMIAHGTMEPAAARAILDGTPLILVGIFRADDGTYYVRVSVR